VVLGCLEPKPERDTLRIFWIKAGGLVPADTGGKIRSLNTLKELAKHHEVSVFTFYRKHDGDRHPQLAGLFHEVVAVPMDVPASKSARDVFEFASSLLLGRSHTMQKWYRPKARRRLSEFLEGRRFDVIVCDFLFPAGMLDWTLDASYLLFTHNVEARVWERFYRVTTNPALKLASFLEYRALSREEKRYVRKADHVLTVADTDRAFFSRYVDPEKITNISTGVDLEYFAPTGVAQAPNSIVFTGSMDWMPNEDGVIWFVREVFEDIRRAVPDATFTIVGRRPSAAVQALEQVPGVRVTGTVEDIRPYLHEGSVYVVPVRSGSGTRLKIFEAMAAGKAAVSTTIGAEGLPVIHDENILLADAADDFAAAVVALLGDPDRRRRLGDAARALVQAKYGWDSVGAEVDAVLRTMMSHRAPEHVP
jgi:sugar transferase (PEP-CTERM/EpsH1 system associated)